MGKGRKSTPSRILELRGGTSHSHKKPRDQEPQPPESMPDIPDHLDKEAQTEWKRCGDILQSIGLMTELDMAVFAGYCDSFSQWGKATKEVQKMGMVYKKTDGTPGLNPYLRVAREAYQRMMQAAVLLGLSPSSRASLKVEKPKPASKAQKFMARKRGS